MKDENGYEIVDVDENGYEIVGAAVDENGYEIVEAAKPSLLSRLKSALAPGLRAMGRLWLRTQR